MGVSSSKDPSRNGLSKSQVRSLLQRKLCLSEDNPEPVFDVSGCQLSSLPPSVYAKCKVLLKRRLQLNDNCLTSLDTDGSLSELAHVLHVLDVSRNRLDRLPDSLWQLQQLQVLDVSGNRVKHLPSSVSQLVNLRVFSCADNHLSQVPVELGQIAMLRSLDLSRNRLKSEFVALNNAHTMRELKLDGNVELEWPSQQTINEGSEAVILSICQKIGKQRVVIEQLLDDVAAETTTASTANGTALQVGAGLLEIQRQQEQGRLVEEKELARQEKQRQQLVLSLSEQQCRLDDQLTNLARVKQNERERLLRQLCQMERSADETAVRISALSSRLSDPDEITARLQADEQRLKDLVAISVCSESLRKQEIFQSMLALMEEKFLTDKLHYSEAKRRDDIIRDTMTRDREMESQLQDLFQLRDQEQQTRLKALQNNEIFQKEAFHSLFLEQDGNRQAIIASIVGAEQALARLTLLEFNHKNDQNNVEKERLSDKRRQLAELLAQLLSQRDIREQQLRLRLQELEERRQQDSNMYWLIQFQKLLDNKPTDIKKSEIEMDQRVKCLLEECGLAEFKPLFAVKQITYKSLLYMNADDLREIGMKESARDVLLAHIAKLSDRSSNGKEEPQKDAAVREDLQTPSAPPDSPPTTSSGLRPTTSSVEPPDQDDPPSAPDEVLLRMEMECAVCMERKTEVVFLTCGHACSCRHCSGQLDKCPMCRKNISQRLLMSGRPDQ